MATYVTVTKEVFDQVIAAYPDLRTDEEVISIYPRKIWYHPHQVLSYPDTIMAYKWLGRLDNENDRYAIREFIYRDLTKN